MKKVLTVALALALAISLAGCNTSPGTAGTSGTDNSGTTSSPNTVEATYPKSNITLVVPYDAGGASDLMARAYGTELGKALGVNVVIENRSGGSGLVGTEYVNAQASDGYTILYLEGNICLNCAIGNSDLDPTEAFTSFVRSHVNPLIICVPADSEIETLSDLIAAAQADPAGITIANSATGGQSDLATYDLEQKGNCVFTHVPYDGAAGAVAACVGKNVDAVIASSADEAASVESGDLKAIAVLSKDHDALFEDVTTSYEQGYEVEAVGWGSFAVKSDVPQEIIDILVEASSGAINSDSVLTLCDEKGYKHATLLGSEANDFKDSVFDTYVDVAKVMGYID